MLTESPNQSPLDTAVGSPAHLSTCSPAHPPSPSLLSAFLDGYRSPDQIAADHDISIDEILDFYESESFRQALDRHESLAIARARGILTAAYPKAVQVLAETVADTEAPPYSRRNAAHTLTRLVHGAPFPPLRAPSARSDRTATVRERTERPPPPFQHAAPSEPALAETAHSTASQTTPRSEIETPVTETPGPNPPQDPGQRSDAPRPGNRDSSIHPSPSRSSLSLCASVVTPDPQSEIPEPQSPSPFDDIADWISSPTGPPPRLTPGRAAALNRALRRGIAELAALRSKGTPATPEPAAPSFAGNPARLPITSARSPP